MRRISIVISIVVVVLLGVVAAGRTVPTTAQDATPAAGGQGFVGSWWVTVTITGGPSVRSLSTIHDDGTIVNSGSPAQPPPPLPGAPGGVVFVSAAHGAWEATGPDGLIATFSDLWADEQGNPAGTLTVRTAVTLGADGQTFSGPFVSTFADPGGNVVAEFPGSIEATRIVAEPPGTPTAGTPVA